MATKVQPLPKIPNLSSSYQEAAPTTTTRRRKSRTSKTRQSDTCKRLSEPKVRNSQELSRQCSRTFIKDDRQPQVTFEAFAAPKRPVTMPPRKRTSQEDSAGNITSNQLSSSRNINKTASEDRDKSQSKRKSKNKDEPKTNQEIPKTRKKISKSQTRKKENSKNAVDGLTMKKETLKFSPQVLATKAGGVQVNPSVQKIATQKVQEAKEELIQKALNLAEKKPGDTEQNLLLRQITEQAEMDHKIFSSFERRRHVAQPIREELLRRGWVEYVPSEVNGIPIVVPRTNSASLMSNHTEAAVSHFQFKGSTKFHVTPPTPSEALWELSANIREFGEKHGKQDIIEAANLIKKKSAPKQDNILDISQIIEDDNKQITYVLFSSHWQDELHNFSYVPSIGNRLQSTTFCSKLGLMENFKENLAKIAQIDVRFPVKYPRMYDLGKDEDTFKLDFMITAVVSLLRWFVDNVKNTEEDSIFEENAAITSEVVEIAIKKAKKFTTFWKTGDVQIIENLSSESDWETFLQSCHEIIHETKKLQTMRQFPKANLCLRALMTWEDIKRLQPQMNYDGYANLWIVKPYSSACGRGIFLTNNIEYLQQLPIKHYIVQKYIERPLLIHGTKFDIRQWFLVTSLQPLEFWIYEDSYLRFCSTPYDETNLHESVHLTNNAIQKKYICIVDPYNRHQAMWDSAAFEKYLREQGHSKLWKKKIFPAMRDALICAIKCSEHTFDRSQQRDGWYQLFGADFMLTSDFSGDPWLIEINHGPALGPSTPVTSALTNKMLRDIVKVVVDRREDANADTGGWVLAFQERAAA